MNIFRKYFNEFQTTNSGLFQHSSEFKDFLTQNCDELSENSSISIFSLLNDTKESDFFEEFLSELMNKSDFTDIIDTNHNGKIEKEELENFLNSIDEDKNSEISFDELFKGLDNLKKTSENKPQRTQAKTTSSTQSTQTAGTSGNTTTQSKTTTNQTEQTTETQESEGDTQTEKDGVKDDTNTKETTQKDTTQTVNPNIKTEFLTDEKTGMQYLMMSPENPDPNKEYPVLVFMSGEAQHGAGEKGLYADTTPAGAMKDWDLENFDGYVIIPYQKQGLKNWYNDYAANGVKSILDNLNAEQNTGKTVIVGASSGAPGAGYIANKLGNEYFDETVCIAEVIYGKKEPDMPVSYYVGSEDGKIRDMRNKIGDDLNIVEGSTHGSVVKDLFNIDSNNDGKSDFLQELFEE